LDDNNYTNAINTFMKIEKLSQRDSFTENNISSESDLIKNLTSILLFQNDVYKKIYNPNQELKLLKDIQEFIEMSYLKKLMLQDLMNISGLSKYYLIRRFEQEYGISPHQYLTSLRINHAREIMRRNNNISDVALEAGFYDQSHFTKTFKEHTGTTPMKYLNDIRR